MSESVTTFQANTSVTYHLLQLRGIEDPPPAPRGGYPNGLVTLGPGPDSATIVTGVALGVVDVTVLLASKPPSLNLEEWEEVVEVSIESSHGSLYVCGLDGDLPDLPNLATVGPGHYRLRIHARGRDVNPDGTARTPSESYLIIVWPASPAPEVIHKQSDAYGAMRRQSSAAAPN
ncbi:hypothetical protein [Nonomuraea basaltis]|uniref:hypothetical protein n=1 Tax=Nonomuraea basaltis TaxID=2495887 RepID=UPI00110C57E3|nr:hypothetical protein [Nonomuraea basaltis]TMR92829.1 hypothetical protein EJK15_42505 [Nonomuraea basaltis]